MRLTGWLLILTCVLIFTSCKEEKTVQKIDDGPKSTLDLVTIEIEKNPANPNLYYKRAQIHFEKEDYDDAINDLREAIFMDSLQPDYYHLLSDAFMDNANSSRSIMAMEKVVALFPDRAISKLKLAENYYITQQYDKAITMANRILQKDAANSEAYFMLGLNFRAKGDEKSAINSFQKATELDPTLVDAWIILGNIFDEKKMSIAAKYFDTAINVDPKNVNALHAKAFYLQNNGDIPGALALYRKINLVDREYPDAYLNAGILYNEMDSLDKAYEQFNIMAKVQPASSSSYYYRAFTLYRMGNIEDAKRDLQNALNINPDFERAKELLAQLAKENN